MLLLVPCHVRFGNYFVISVLQSTVNAGELASTLTKTACSPWWRIIQEKASLWRGPGSLACCCCRRSNMFPSTNASVSSCGSSFSGVPFLLYRVMPVLRGPTPKCHKTFFFRTETATNRIRLSVASKCHISATVWNCSVVHCKLFPTEVRKMASKSSPVCIFQETKQHFHILSEVLFQKAQTKKKLLSKDKMLFLGSFLSLLRSHFGW